MKKYIRTAKEARAAIGKQVAWDDPYLIRLSKGMLEDAEGKNLLIDGDWKWRSRLSGLHVVEQPDCEAAA